MRVLYQTELHPDVTFLRPKRSIRRKENHMMCFLILYGVGAVVTALTMLFLFAGIVALGRGATIKQTILLILAAIVAGVFWPATAIIFWLKE